MGTESQGSEGYEVDATPIEADWGRLVASGRYAEVGDWWVPESIDLELYGDEGSPTTRARIEVRDGRPEIVRVEIVSRAGEPSVRQSDLRAIQVEALVELLAGFGVKVPVGTDVIAAGLDPEQYAVALGELRQMRGPRKITPAFLERVAEVYKANVDDNPTLAVRRTFFVGERMASDYVQRARREGLLPPTTPGRKKA